MPQTSNFVQSQLINFLVPADGTTHCVLTAVAASGQAYQINWLQFSNDNFKFNPQGAYIDNTAGAATLILKSVNIGVSIYVPAGQFLAVPFPASPNDTWFVTGNGQANIYWVDYPVFPFNYGGPAGGNSVVTIGGQPVAVTLPANYQNVETPFNRNGNSTYRLAVTNAATAALQVAANAGDNSVRVYNKGPNDVFIVVGGAAVAAPVYPTAGNPQPGYVIAAGNTETLGAQTGGGYIRAICELAGYTADLYVVYGTGA